MTPDVSRELTIPALTAAAAFAVVEPGSGVSLDVSGDEVRLRGPSPAALNEVAERMHAWIDSWIDVACRDLFAHPAFRARPAPPRP